VTDRYETTHDAAAFDDDRLLAFALGLEDDPELEAAAADDAVLRDRLAAMRADVGAVAAGLDRVVPAPPDGYVDLREERWGELRDLMTAPAPAEPRRRPFWLRVIAPAAAIALVLVAGVVGLQHLGVGSDDATLEMQGGDKSAESSQARDGVDLSGDEGAGSAVTDSMAPSVESAVPDPALYATVLVARAAPPTDLRQRFDVLRVLRDANAASWGIGDVVRLTIVDETVTSERLVVLYLDPSGVLSSPGTTGGTATPSPNAGDTRGLVIEYVYHGRPALARMLPSGTDPNTVTLP